VLKNVLVRLAFFFTSIFMLEFTTYATPSQQENKKILKFFGLNLKLLLYTDLKPYLKRFYVY
jgi:hypothetical protein